MSQIEARLRALGLQLPPPIQPPPGVVLPFEFVQISGTRVLISGHGPQNSDGSIAAPLGKLGRDLSVEQGCHAARLTALSILGSLQRALGDLDRIRNWGRFFGMVNSATGCHQRFLTVDPRSLRVTARRPCAQRRRHGRIAVQYSGRDRRRGRDRLSSLCCRCP